MIQGANRDPAKLRLEITQYDYRLRTQKAKGGKHPFALSVGQITMVREEGLEPTHLTVLVPKTSASTNSATLACATKNIKKK